jgi:membrane dipeptidase
MNAKIEQCRQVALDILRPSKRELDHGLGLHKESIVWDAYGFAPTSAGDPKVFARAIENGVGENEWRQLVEEMGMTRHVNDPVGRAEYEEAWDASGVTCVFQNAGEEGNRIDRIIRRHARFTYVTDKLRDFVARAAWPGDVEQAKADGRHCLYFSANGVPLLQRWDTVEDEVGAIRTFFELGCRMMHLTYNRWNPIGAGCGERTTGGLSDFGEHVVREMNRVGVIVDVAHAGLQTGRDAARVASKPIVSSHAVCAALNAHCRAKTDDLLRAIFDTGGYCGICCIPGFLGHAGDITALLDHIDHIVKTFGADYVAIGTDKGYQIEGYDDDDSVTFTPPGGLPRFRTLWPEDSFPEKYKADAMVRSLAWTNWPLFTVGLVQRGHSDEEIRKIIGGNVLRVAREVLRDIPTTIGAQQACVAGWGGGDR